MFINLILYINLILNLISDTEDICNELNKFFANIAESSVKHLPHQE